MKQRKAQITVFIIIAILLLFSTALILYTRSQVVERLAEREIVEEVPIEFEPVKSFIEDCIEQKAVEALEHIGRHGGYTNPAEWGFNKFSEFAPTESPANSLYTFGSVHPYWWYLDDSNKCEKECTVGALIPHLYRDKRNPQSLLNADPSILSVEVQLDEYINGNLGYCIGDFFSLKEMDFEITELGRIDTTTTVAEETVIFDVKYPLEVKKEGATKRITRHRLVIPLNLKAIYEEANKIIATEKETWFLEMHTLNLITSFEDFDKLPFQSYSYTSMSPSPIWTEWETKNLLEAMLTAYVPALQIPGSRNYQFRYAFDEFGLYETHADVPMVGNENLETRFEYLGWPVYLDLGAEGQVVKCEFAGITFPVPIGVVRCETPYDLSYPVAITIEDPFAFNNQGYSFTFALEACIRNNEPCSLTYTETKYNPVPRATQFCDEIQRTADCDDCSDATFVVEDITTDEKLEDTLVTYICGEDACSLGNTDTGGTLKAKLPPCLQALVDFKKTSPYLEELELLGTVDGQKIDVVKELEPYTDIDITVLKRARKKVPKGGGFVYKWQKELSEPEPLDADETATITMTRINNLLEGNFPPVVTTVGKDEKATVTLVPGDYEVTIQLYRTDELVIPKDKRQECTSGGLFHSSTCTTYWMPGPEHVVLAEEGDTLFSGGALFNENTGYIKIDRDMLDKNLITFYAISHNLYDVPFNTNQEPNVLSSPFRVIEDLDYVLFDVEEYTQKYREYIQPTVE